MLTGQGRLHHRQLAVPDQQWVERNWLCHAGVAHLLLLLQAEVPSAPTSLPSLASSPADEDEEMLDAEETGDGDAEAGDGQEISPAMAEAAAAVGIDLAFFQALPAELRGEVRQ